MSSAIDAVANKTNRPPLPWALWLRQIAAIFRIELQKNFLGRRSLLIYLLALLPLFPLFVLALFQPPGNEWRDFNNYSIIYSALYNALILRTVVFFGCAWIFMNLFRGEIVDRSLHYYFLSGVRREVLVVGKYFSGLVTSIILFTVTTVAAMLLLYLPHFYSQSMRYFVEGKGLGQILTYAGITMLACVGYGAFFVVVGLFVRNPIIPALLLYGWEWLNFLLPPLLKKVSVIHYLNSLTPVPLSEGPFAVVAEPTPAWIAIPSMLGVTVIVLIIAAYRIRHMEVQYGSD
ncbi:MAG TPA: ABC transporter permease [Pyrinomonadaceae bacterium]|jgi:ABC-type transport system involved in multi-copper enzyme maturation permease subunit